jgi:hypothetical protein
VRPIGTDYKARTDTTAICELEDSPPLLQAPDRPHFSAAKRSSRPKCLLDERVVQSHARYRQTVYRQRLRCRAGKQQLMTTDPDQPHVPGWNRPGKLDPQVGEHTKRARRQ